MSFVNKFYWFATNVGHDDRPYLIDRTDFHFRGNTNMRPETVFQIFDNIIVGVFT